MTTEISVCVNNQNGMISNIMYLADTMAYRYAELSIPTGELYRGIALNNYTKAKQNLLDAVNGFAESFDIVGLAEEQRNNPSPFGGRPGHVF